jgi:hypothetical protein
VCQVNRVLVGGTRVGWGRAEEVGDPLTSERELPSEAWKLDDILFVERMCMEVKSVGCCST